LILRKIIKIVARVQQGSDFKAKMHQIIFGCGSALDPAGGPYSAPPNPLAALNWPASKGRERKELAIHYIINKARKTTSTGI